MTSLSNHQSSAYTKLLLIGDSGSGKTGSLASLVKAGFKLRIIDLDNGLDVLRLYIMRDCPDKIDNVEFRTIRDKIKSSPVGPVIDGPAKAFVEATKMIDNWKYTTDDGIAVDLGPPATWGKDCILVIDSLTLLSEAAMNWAMMMVPRSKDGKFDGRAVYFEAQKAIRSTLSYLTSESLRVNVIVTAHIRYTDMPDGTKKGFPTSAGEALNPEIPRYFNSTVRFLTDPSGKRTIQTGATPLMDLKNPAPFKVASVLPIETGLADFFQQVRS